VTSFRNLISLVGKSGWNIDHFDVVTTFLNPEVDDEDIYVTLPDGGPEGLNVPTTIAQPKKPLYSFKQAPQLWHNDIDTFLLSLEFTQS